MPVTVTVKNEVTQETVTRTITNALAVEIKQFQDANIRGETDDNRTDLEIFVDDWAATWRKRILHQRQQAAAGQAQEVEVMAP